MASEELKRLAGEQFVSLATFRRNGEAVATPVWVAQDATELVVTTPAGTGKVKRLRRDPKVTLVPCTRRGVVSDGAVPVPGTARIEEQASEIDRLHTRLGQKYGWQFRAITLAERLFARGHGQRVILRITLD